MAINVLTTAGFCPVVSVRIHACSTAWGIDVGYCRALDMVSYSCMGISALLMGIVVHHAALPVPMPCTGVWLTATYVTFLRLVDWVATW